MKIYLAGPLFNETERAFNRTVRDLLVRLGHDVYLPQEDGGVLYDMTKEGKPVDEVEKELFEGDLAAIRGSDMLVCILNGRVPDEGMCVEMGFAYALGKTCIGYSTDARVFDIYMDRVS